MFQLPILKNKSSWWPRRSSLDWECSYSSDPHAGTWWFWGDLAPGPLPATLHSWPMACPLLLHPPALPHPWRGLMWPSRLHIQVPITPLLCSPPFQSTLWREDGPGEEDWLQAGETGLGPSGQGVPWSCMPRVCSWKVWVRCTCPLGPTDFLPCGEGGRPDKNQRGALLKCWPRVRSLLLDRRAHSLAE